MSDSKDLHTHPDKVLSHCPINLTQRMDGCESRSVMGYSPFETHRPGGALHKTPGFIVAAFLLSKCFHSAFRYPLRYFRFLYSAFPAAGWQHKRLILTLLMCFCLAWERFRLWLELASMSGLPEGPGR